jgi:hypothetical protein
MLTIVRIISLAFILLCAESSYAQVEDDEEEEFSHKNHPPVDLKSTSATDHKVRIHRVKRTNTDVTTERHGKAIKKKRDGANGTGKEAKVFKRHRHFASRDIRTRNKSRVARKEMLGVGE